MCVCVCVTTDVIGCVSRYIFFHRKIVNPRPYPSKVIDRDAFQCIFTKKEDKKTISMVSGNPRSSVFFLKKIMFLSVGEPRTPCPFSGHGNPLPHGQTVKKNVSGGGLLGGGQLVVDRPFFSRPQHVR